jgi:hypothetical protein
MALERRRRRSPSLLLSFLLSSALVLGAGLPGCRQGGSGAAGVSTGGADQATPAAAVGARPSAPSAPPSAHPGACGGLAESVCQTTTTCQPIMGANAAGGSEYAGCFTAVVDGAPKMCAEAFTCGRAPGSARRCLQFSSSCLPDGWTAVPACDQPGCPKPAP